MTASFEPSVEPIGRRWYRRNASGLSYVERSNVFKKALPNAREFVILLEEQNFVPVRHLIAKAIRENDDQGSVYAGIQGEGLRVSGTIENTQHAKFDDSNGSFFASTIDHINGNVQVPPNLDLDPFILFHLGQVEKPTIVSYDTSKLEQTTETRWVPRANETLLSAVNGVYHLSPKKSS